MQHESPDRGEPLLRIVDLHVQFPGVHAVDGVSLTLRRGEIIALVGENGAGKSTLLRVLGGVQRPTAGELRLRGEPFRPAHPSEAIAAGLAVIYQEFTLFPHLTVAENVFIGREPRHPLTRGIDYPAMRTVCRELFARLGVDLDPDAPVSELAVSAQQLVEIARALSVDGEVIVMDEPTAALSRAETTRLLEIVRQLRDGGTSVVFVSHHLDEVFAIADRIVVLRDGSLVADVLTDAVNAEEVVRLMVGRDVRSIARRDAVAGEVLLELCAVNADPLADVDLEVRSGEVLGVGGIAGAGQSELGRVVFGDLRVTSGEMRLAGESFAPSTPRAAMRRGIGFLHEDRKAAGNFPDLSVLQNATVTILDRLRGILGLLSASRERSVYEDYRARLRIKSSDPDESITNLSGGNQQKVLLARALARGDRLVVLNEPTRGVDVGAKAEIHELVRSLADAGLSVVMITSDLPELLELSDRIVVLSRGRVVGRLSGPDRTEENVIACASAGMRIGVAS